MSQELVQLQQSLVHIGQSLTQIAHTIEKMEQSFSQTITHVGKAIEKMERIPEEAPVVDLDDKLEEFATFTRTMRLSDRHMPCHFINESETPYLDKLIENIVKVRFGQLEPGLRRKQMNRVYSTLLEELR